MVMVIGHLLVRQGCILEVESTRLSIANDWTLGHMSEKPGIDVGSYRFTHCSLQ